MPRISVVIPTYNRAHMIGETLDTVLAQTYQDFEVIVVDDGSTDNTLDVLSTYGERIRAIRKSHRGGGGAFARNNGIREATGDFVAFLDSDDLWLPTKLERQMAFFDENPSLAWVYSDAEVFDAENARTLYFYSQETRLHQGYVLHHLFLEDFIPSPTPVVRRAVFSEVGDFWPSPKATDWDMWLRIAARHHVGFVGEPLARHRVHQATITASHSWEMSYNTCKTIIDRAVARQPERLEPLRNQAIARLCIRTGRSLSGMGCREEARAMFVKAIRYRPSVPQAYLFWATTLLGSKVLGKLIQINRLRRRAFATRARRPILK